MRNRYQSESLFTTKELYQMAHNANGSSNIINKIPKPIRRKVLDANMHLMEGMDFENGFPKLKCIYRND